MNPEPKLAAPPEKRPLLIEGVSEEDAMKIAEQDAILARYAETVAITGVPSTINYCIGAAHARKMIRSVMHAIMWRVIRGGPLPAQHRLRQTIEDWLR